MKRNVWATFQFETSNVDFTRQAFSADRIMWSSDYPHTDSPWPRSREFITEAFKNIPEMDAAKITANNAAQLYGMS
jgi:predicted TIM-barrel fold metal-dependent hydrolase